MEIDDKGWLTTINEYKGYTLNMKSKRDHGIKCHCLKDGKEIFTQRFSFINPELLLKRMQDRIDKMISGEWTPKKLTTPIEH